MHHEGEEDIPNLFGRGYLAVLSDSMTTDGEDSIDKGDLLYVRILTDETRAKLEREMSSHIMTVAFTDSIRMRLLRLLKMKMVKPLV